MHTTQNQQSGRFSPEKVGRQIPLCSSSLNSRILPLSFFPHFSFVSLFLVLQHPLHMELPCLLSSIHTKYLAVSFAASAVAARTFGISSPSLRTCFLLLQIASPDSRFGLHSLPLLVLESQPTNPQLMPSRLSAAISLHGIVDLCALSMY